jgi:response regulator of citrate/malate metabolism
MISVVVVDDDFRVAGINAAYVRQVEGFRVVGQAHTAAQAVATIDSLRPELILLDFYLPDENGLTVMRRLTERPHRPDVLAVTAARDVTSVRAAMQLGAVAYLVKPFRAVALRERLIAYRDLRARLTSMNEADQHDVDALYGLLHAASAATTPLPAAKGHSGPTIGLVLDAVRAAASDVSAAEVAAATGVSRPTAQRYLSYLVRHKVLALRLRYGTNGRPEHRYLEA